MMEIAKIKQIEKDLYAEVYSDQSLSAFSAFLIDTIIHPLAAKKSFNRLDILEFLMDKDKLNLVDVIKDSKNAKIINKDNVTVIPLMVEGVSTAVLLIEDLKNDEKDEIFILCSQLAMELKTKFSYYVHS